MQTWLGKQKGKMGTAPSGARASDERQAIPKPEKPFSLQTQLRRASLLSDREVTLKEIEQNLHDWIQTAQGWEAQKLLYHDDHFAYVSSLIQNVEEQLVQLAANFIVLRNMARAIETLYSSFSTPLPAKSPMLEVQLKLFSDHHGEIAGELQACLSLYPQTVKAIERLLQQTRQKLTALKIALRQQQEDYLLRTPDGNKRWNEKLERLEAKLHVALIEVEALWKIAQEKHAEAIIPIEELNKKQNGQRAWKGAYATPLLKDPFAIDPGRAASGQLAPAASQP